MGRAQKVLGRAAGRVVVVREIDHMVLFGFDVALRSDGMAATGLGTTQALIGDVSGERVYNYGFGKFEYGRAIFFVARP